MNRDIVPTHGEAIYEAGLIVAAVLSAAESGELTEPGLPGAVTQIRGILATVWPNVTPEAVTDALTVATTMASGQGDPARAAEAATGPAAAQAGALLELAVTPGHREHRTRLVRARAGTLASDPAQDETAMLTLAVLLAVALTPETRHG